MGSTFSSVVTLIAAAQVFAEGLISLNFIEALVAPPETLGFSGAFVSLIIALVVFLAAMLMGSGNASFFSFGPLLPNIATSLIACQLGI